MKPYCVTIQMKAIEQYFHVVLFIMLYKVVLTFKSLDETLVCDHSNVSYEQCYHLVLLISLCIVVITIISVDETLVCDRDQMKTYSPQDHCHL